MSGKFIVVEGLEGAGKSSVIALIETLVNAKGHKTITTREPGGTPMAEAIRECVKQNWQETVVEETELMLMYAAIAPNGSTTGNDPRANALAAPHCLRSRGTT